MLFILPGLYERNHIHALLVACAASVYDNCCLGYWNEENERKLRQEVKVIF